MLTQILAHVSTFSGRLSSYFQIIIPYRVIRRSLLSSRCFLLVFKWLLYDYSSLLGCGLFFVFLNTLIDYYKSSYLESHTFSAVQFCDTIFIYIPMNIPQISKNRQTYRCPIDNSQIFLPFWLKITKFFTC